MHGFNCQPLQLFEALEFVLKHVSNTFAEVGKGVILGDLDENSVVLVYLAGDVEGVAQGLELLVEANVLV